jgi:hypothetical protein
MQKAPYRNPENASCDQYKEDLLDEKIKGELRGSPLINSYISADITSWQ